MSLPRILRHGADSRAKQHSGLQRYRYMALIWALALSEGCSGADNDLAQQRDPGGSAQTDTEARDGGPAETTAAESTGAEATATESTATENSSTSDSIDAVSEGSSSTSATSETTEATSSLDGSDVVGPDEATAAEATGPDATAVPDASTGAGENSTDAGVFADDTAAIDQDQPLGDASSDDATSSTAQSPQVQDSCELPLEFESPPPFAVGRQPLWVAAADVDVDGTLDLISTSQVSPTITIRYGQFDAQFAPISLYPTEETEYMGQGAVADLTGDGLLDIAVASDTGVRILRNLGERKFEVLGTLILEDLEPIALTAADLSGDELPDLAIATNTDDVSVAINLGAGVFGEPTSYPAGPGTRDVAAGDINADSLADLVVANGADSTVSVLRNLGAGVFDEPTTHFTGQAPISVAVVDLDQDGDRDIASANFASNDVAVLLNHDQGTFDEATINPVGGSSPYSLAAADLNLDGAPELVIANAGTSNVSLLVNHGDGTFDASVESSIGQGPVSVTTGDFNLDGMPDVAAAAYNYGDGSVPMDGLIYLLLNRCEAL